MVSVKHRVASAVVREPLPCNKSDRSNCRGFPANVFVVNSGYRARYPLVAAATGGWLG